LIDAEQAEDRPLDWRKLSFVTNYPCLGVESYGRLPESSSFLLKLQYHFCHLPWYENRSRCLTARFRFSGLIIDRACISWEWRRWRWRLRLHHPPT